MVLVQVLPNDPFVEMISFELYLEKSKKKPETAVVSGFFEPISFSVRIVVLYRQFRCHRGKVNKIKAFYILRRFHVNPK